MVYAAAILMSVLKFLIKIMEHAEHGDHDDCHTVSSEQLARSSKEQQERSSKGVRRSKQVAGTNK